MLMHLCLFRDIDVSEWALLFCVLMSVAGYGIIITQGLNVYVS